ncbi:sensor histidine kinase [Mastigocladopsis repens]|uniref:sensor histidine kinase n=1 Tax=Mastigocladopsis repens TaxID=221287 RepID=UPI0003065F3E|nr:ATP-binding protein [Mastigocladopsis repens]
MKRVFYQLSIRQKIVCGYVLALSVAIVGTVAGFLIGEYQQQKAVQKHDDAIEEIELLNRLQNAVLQTRTHQQQFIPLVPNLKQLQNEHSHFLVHGAEINQLWSKLKSYVNRPSYKQQKQSEGIRRLLQTYNGVPEEYLQQVEELIRQIDQPSLKLEEVTAAQKLLLNFTNSPVALKFDGISDDLIEVIKGSYQERAQAQAALLQVEKMRLTLIVGFLLLSIVLGAILAFSISRAIARPLRTVTDIAQRVTEDANFDLQAPVTTKDEVGELATSLNQLIKQVKQLLEEQEAETQARLIQSEKMSSLGRMLAGVAHEIINPVNFISGNLVHAKNYVDDLLALLQTYKAEVPPPAAVQALAKEIDLEFLEADLPKLLNSIAFGADRTREIARSLKDFSRLDTAEVQLVNIHTCINSTLLILQNRLKMGINVICNYGDIPSVPGHTGLLYQVFMNLLSNAIDAVEEMSAINSEWSPEISILTERWDNNWVKIRIADNGMGIAPQNQDKIFEMFFTTKPRGVGTGLGLSISYQIIVEKHLGEMTFKSELQQGTEFTISLPIDRS